MPISVVCPGCHKRFNVSDRFAGQKGPCPSCKTIIQVPKEKVVVHGPEEFASGGRGKSGRMVSRPLRQIQLHYSTTQWALMGAGILSVLILTPLLGNAGVFESLPFLAILGQAIVSPLLVFVLYPFLRANEELDPFAGHRLRTRAIICGLALAATWWGFELGAHYTFTGVAWQWWIAIPFVVAGVLAVHATLDLDPSTSSLLYAVYVGVMIVLRWMAGLGWVWMILRASTGDPTAPPDPSTLL